MNQIKCSGEHISVRGNARIRIFLVFILLCGLSDQLFSQDCGRKQLKCEAMVDTLFLGFLHEKFFIAEGLREESGWMMELPSGKMVTRSFLRLQADTIISIGNDAVPCLFKWVMNDNLFIRYIALYSLEQITGISSGVAYFDKEDLPGNRQKAIKTYDEWWEKQKEKK